jgi:hypothetical protein
MLPQFWSGNKKEDLDRRQDTSVLKWNIYKTLARPALYGSEAWTIRKTDEKTLQAAEIKFTRKTSGFTLLDHKRN